MTIDQRNAGASVTVTGLNFSVDRWFGEGSQSSKFTMQQNAGSVTPPAGFTNYLGATSSAATSLGPTDYFIIQQRIEGFNFADLGWGTANAKTVTLSFQVYSSLTGTFGGVFLNNANNRSYPFSYSIPAANTWTTISITIAGDTTGTWVGATNGTGLKVIFSLGTGSTYSGTAGAWAGSLLISATGATSVVGTSGATFYITGVQFEVGTQATSFEYRQYGTELALCQRYYAKTFNIATAPASGAGQQGSLFTACGSGTAAGSAYLVTWTFPVSMRAAPTVTTFNPSTAGQTGWYDQVGANVAAGISNEGTAGAIVFNSGTATTTRNAGIHLTASIEL
jgi:hypothetical protein